MDKRIVSSLAGGISLVWAVNPAFADGMPSLKDTVAAPEVPTWTGPYFGASLGYGHNDSVNRYRDSTGDRSSRDEDADGGLVSLIWGYDCQFDRFIVGGFIDVDWSDIDRGTVGDGLTIDRSFNIGGRLGALITPNTMAFVTAGYSRAHFDNDGWWDITDDTSGAILPGRGSQDFDGYFIGGGLEHRLGNGFFLRGEVRYADYGTEISNSGVADDGLGTTYVDTEDAELWTGRIGLVYKLGRGEPFHGSADGDDRLKVITYYGIDVAEDIWTVYSGGLVALNGDLTRSGIVARTFGWYSDLDGSGNSAAPDGKDRAVDAMVGYLHYFGTTSAIGYVGMEIRDVEVNPGYEETETGFKVAFELESGDENPFYYSFDTSYSTAFDTYYGQLRLGYNRNGTKFGPEGEVWDEESDTTTRLGAFVAFPLTLVPSMPAELSVSGGYQWVDENDDNNGGNGDDTFGLHGGEGGYFNSMVKFIF